MRIGIFGGSFDPPHIGHVLTAVDAVDTLSLDRLFWVPAAKQPLKNEEPVAASSATLGVPDSAPPTGSPSPHSASADDRYAMVEAAAEAHPKFGVSRIELDRNGLSYTVTTVEAFAQAYPNSERFLLMGADAWSQFHRWYQPERIRTFVQVAVLARTSETVEGSADTVANSDPDYRLPTRLIDISSTEVRARVRASQPIRGFVPDAVAAIIESKGLYRW